MPAMTSMAGTNQNVSARFPKNCRMRAFMDSDLSLGWRADEGGNDTDQPDCDEAGMD